MSDDDVGWTSVLRKRGGAAGSSGSAGLIRSTEVSDESHNEGCASNSPTLTFFTSDSRSFNDRDAGLPIDAAELGRLMVLGDGGIRDVAEPRREAIAMITVCDGGRR